MEEWEIWDEKEKAARSEVEAKKLVLEKFHWWIKSLWQKAVRANAHPKNLGPYD